MSDDDGIQAWAPIEVVEGLFKRAEQAEAAVARVRELHGKHDPNCPYGQDCAGAGLCLACREEYPCATIRALDGSNSPPVTSEITGPLIDPDCRDGKHSSCVGGPCECPCHELAAS